MRLCVSACILCIFSLHTIYIYIYTLNILLDIVFFSSLVCVTRLKLSRLLIRTNIHTAYPQYEC